MKLVKAIIKGLIDRTGYEIRRKPTQLAPDARFGLNVLHGFVESLARRSQPGTLQLLQIGANDGKDEDVVREILLRHPISALLCEPLLDAFAQLELTYSNVSHVRLARCAVGTLDGELNLFRLDPSYRHAEGTKRCPA
jgi:hypothetical protein